MVEAPAGAWRSCVDGGWLVSLLVRCVFAVFCCGCWGIGRWLGVAALVWGCCACGRFGFWLAFGFVVGAWLLRVGSVRAAGAGVAEGEWCSGAAPAKAAGAGLGWLTSGWSEVGGGFAVLFDRWELGPELVEVYRTVLLSDWQDSAAHATGIAATVVRGRVRVGPAGAEREL